MKSTNKKDDTPTLIEVLEHKASTIREPKSELGMPFAVFIKCWRSV